MTPRTRNGFDRLAILAAAATGTAYLIAMTIAALDTPGAVAWRVILFLLITTPIAAGLAWLLIRGIAWVCDGFARRRDNFHRPNWN